jgi:hypothetical protein
MAKVPQLVGPGQRRQMKSERGLMVLGVDLPDAREELFVRMVVDGVAIGIAFIRAGFTSKHSMAPSKLWHEQRCQERAAAILEARRTTGVVTLPEVTDMLKRVFTGAYNGEEYSAAHNAAFSLARLYGHVTDRQILEVVRRPSRDPDAPSEQALSSWVEALPGLPASGLEAPNTASFLRLGDAPAAPLGPEAHMPVDVHTSGPEPRMHVDVHRNNPEKPNDINGLPEFRTLTCIGTEGPARGRPENGAPTGPVTVTPTQRARAGLLATGGSKKGAPLNELQVPDTTGEFPPIEDLF